MSSPATTSSSPAEPDPNFVQKRKHRRKKLMGQMHEPETSSRLPPGGGLPPTKTEQSTTAPMAANGVSTSSHHRRRKSVSQVSEPGSSVPLPPGGGLPPTKTEQSTTAPAPVSSSLGASTSSQHRKKKPVSQISQSEPAAPSGCGASTSVPAAPSGCGATTSSPESGLVKQRSAEPGLTGTEKPAAVLAAPAEPIASASEGEQRGSTRGASHDDSFARDPTVGFPRNEMERRVFERCAPRLPLAAA